MAISTEKRKAGPFTSNGTAVAYNFQFKVFSTSQVAVLHSDANGRSDVVLDKGAYSVKLNRNQDEQPGGVVTLNSPLPAGVTLSVLSDIPALQEMVLTNRGGFYPEVLNDSADKAIALIQQLEEKSERTLTVPASSSKTPSDLMSELLAAQSDASKYADAAAQSAATAGEIEKRLTDQEAGIAAQLTQIGEQKISEITAEGGKYVGEIRAEGAAQKKIVTDEGQRQIERIEAAGNTQMAVNGYGGSEHFWELSAPVPANSEITIPVPVQYIVGRHHLRVSWNGLVLGVGQFSEVGTENTFSKKFTLAFDAKVGDEIDVWVGPLGTGNVDTAIVTAAEARDAIADMSRRVVYKDKQSAGG